MKQKTTLDNSVRRGIMGIGKALPVTVSPPAAIEVTAKFGMLGGYFFLFWIRTTVTVHPLPVGCDYAPAQTQKRSIRKSLSRAGDNRTAPPSRRRPENEPRWESLSPSRATGSIVPGPMQPGANLHHVRRGRGIIEPYVPTELLRTTRDKMLTISEQNRNSSVYVISASPCSITENLRRSQ